MTKKSLEKYQVLIYIIAIISGLIFGVSDPSRASVFEPFLWPVLACLLFVTFTQVSLLKLIDASKDIRFMSTAIAGNFVLIPVIVWIIILLLPDVPAIRLGVAMVLLVPCTDWFITFTQLGGGDANRAILFSPVSLLLQIILLPVYLFLFFENTLTISLATNNLLAAFTGVILLPLFAAYLIEKWAETSANRKLLISRLGWLPVPILALVIFMISASQSHVVFGSSSILWYPAVAFVSFLFITAVLSKILSLIVKLPVSQGRVLAFSLGSRNSFVVLPLALALPESFEIAAFVVVLQSLIELFGMAIYTWFIPGVLFRTK